MYRYDASVDPPAAYLSVQMTNPDTGTSMHLLAKIDSGAGTSVLPQTTVADLALEPTGDVLASGYDRKVALRLTYTCFRHLNVLEARSPAKDPNKLWHPPLKATTCWGVSKTGYSVTFEVQSCTIQDVEVTVSPRADVLLGRDVLNHFTLTLNGKDLAFDLKDP